MSLEAGRMGFRLDRLEVLNWGTFDRHVWTLQCRGDNALLTGDIGSGKSTLVDALTTLLVPPRVITYNKAAGADTRERSIKSYVLGHHRMEREEGGSAKAVSLRDVSSYSVLLGSFVSEELAQSVTLAQVFWWKEPQGNPARFYIISDRPLTVAGDFGEFGGEIEGLRKRLRKTPGIELHDSFAGYGNGFRRRFGIESEQALLLFYQTVSMKSVGSLTEFVREHMLEPFPVEERITALLGHFDDLTRAYEVVVRTKEQIGRLAPLVSDCLAHRVLSDRIAELRVLRDALRALFATLKADLLRNRIAELDLEEAALTERASGVAARLANEREKHEQLLAAIRENGGDRLQQIRAALDDRRKARDRRRERADQYAQLANALGLSVVGDLDGFLTNRRSLEAQRAQISDEEAEAQNSLTEAMVEVRRLAERFRELQSELASLRGRRSNIPADSFGIRRALCRAVDASDEAIPFAGELIQVREDAHAWEGAIERVLHGFALSLLVPEQHYAAVASFVDRTDLNGRIVYLRMREGRQEAPQAYDPDLLIERVEVRSDSPYRAWLEKYLASRFAFVCCDNLDQLRRVTKGVTRAGQIKSSVERHEKDDRVSIDNRSRYVLGWTNQRKIAAFEKQASAVAAEGELALRKQSEADQKRQAAAKRLGAIEQLRMFDRFEELDWAEMTLEIDRLEKDRAELEASSDALMTLEKQRVVVSAAISEAESQQKSIEKDLAILGERREQVRKFLEGCHAIISAEPSIEPHIGRLTEVRNEYPGGQQVSLDNCDDKEQTLRKALQARIEEEGRTQQRLGQSIISAMTAYRLAFPNETREVDATLASAGDFELMLGRLRNDDLPRFEARFKSLLNENTIREIANFQSQLNRERHTIGERVEVINASLRGIDYNPGRFIELLAEASGDIEIREFQQQLRACTEGALTGSDNDEYSEQKFLQVKAIIERFRGRSERAEIDRNWTRKVTDVRNWFGFAASERWHEDGREHEHYANSGGKSGGQKEKLAYTVLAASLAYQFGLGGSSQRTRSFRFVLIDEAFGRGSDESAAFGLALFGRLNLQLLVVTPLQKIHVIEPFVANVGFVHNTDGHSSGVRNLTIEEYRAERALRSREPTVVHA